MCDVLGKWFTQTARYLYDLVTFPAVNIPVIAPANGCRYSDEEIEIAAEDCRRVWGLGVGPISNVVGLMEFQRHRRVPLWGSGAKDRSVFVLERRSPLCFSCLRKKFRRPFAL